MPTLSFKYPSALLGKAAPVGAEGEYTKTPDERNLLLGELNSIDQLDPELRFEHTGGLPVACRASVPRITCVKLFGVSVICAVSAAYAPNRDVAVSNGLSCAICLIAACHYFFIWGIRAQSYGPTSAYSAFMTKVGRGPANERDAEIVTNMKRLQARETSIDGYRYSDWTATLVLMALELGRLSDAANPGNTPWVSVYITSALQPVITTLGGVGRFFTNELRAGPDGKYPSVGSTGWWSLVGGGVCYLLAFSIFVFTSATQLDHVGSLSNITDPDRLLDGQIVYAVVLTQIGYTLVAFGSVAYLTLCAVDPRDRTKPLPGNMYSPNLSFAKDFAFSTLDLATKFTLGLYIGVIRVPPT